MGRMFSPITEPLVNAAEALSAAVIWGLIIYGAFQMAQITAIAVRAYYGLRIIKQVSILLREVIQEVSAMRRELRDPLTPPQEPVIVELREPLTPPTEPANFRHNPNGA
jgi:hypothetical protein